MSFFYFFSIVSLLHQTDKVCWALLLSLISYLNFFVVRCWYNIDRQRIAVSGCFEDVSLSVCRIQLFHVLHLWMTLLHSMHVGGWLWLVAGIYFLVSDWREICEMWRKRPCFRQYSKGCKSRPLKVLKFILVCYLCYFSLTMYQIAFILLQALAVPDSSPLKNVTGTATVLTVTSVILAWWDVDFSWTETISSALSVDVAKPKTLINRGEINLVPVVQKVSRLFGPCENSLGRV